MFCEGCGAMVGEDGGGDAFASAPAPASDEPVRSLSDYTSDLPVCPSCGVEGTGESDTCFACGAKLKSQGEMFESQPSFEAAPADFGSPEPAPAFDAAPEPAFEPAPEFTAPAFEPAPDFAAAPATTGKPICVECGGEAEPTDAVCPVCGGVLIASEAPPSFDAPFAPTPAPAPVAAPPPPPMPAFEPTPAPAAAPIEGGKICACCGVENPGDAVFCSSCGVDFD